MVLAEEGELDAPLPQRERLRLARKEEREEVDPLTILPACTMIQKRKTVMALEDADSVRV